MDLAAMNIIGMATFTFLALNFVKSERRITNLMVANEDLKVANERLRTENADLVDELAKREALRGPNR